MNTPIGSHITHATQLVGTWSGGTTHALAAYPADAVQPVGSGPVWLGTATIVRDADYSFFAKRVRVHVPIKGNGIQLHFGAPAEVVTLPTFAQCRFDGARPVRAQLIDGPVTAFNLITHADVEAMVKVVSLAQDAVPLQGEIVHPLHTQAADDTTMLHMLYAISGALTVTHAGQHATMLHADEAFLFHPHALSAAQADTIMLHPLEPHTALVVVDLLIPHIREA